jgi:hypothetical protein
MRRQMEVKGEVRDKREKRTCGGERYEHLYRSRQKCQLSGTPSVITPVSVATVILQIYLPSPNSNPENRQHMETTQIMMCGEKS